MFEESIRQSKPLPDFTGTDAFQVALTLDGTVRDAAFLRFLAAVGEENTATFTTHDWLVLALVAHGDKVPRELRDRLPRLTELGIIERVGPRRYMPAHRFFAFMGDKAAYTRRRGLDRRHNLQLLQRHLKDNLATGSPFRELVDVIPSLGEDGIRSLLRTLARGGQAHFRGQTRAALWFPGPNPDLSANELSSNVLKRTYTYGSVFKFIASSWGALELSGSHPTAICPCRIDGSGRPNSTRTGGVIGWFAGRWNLAAGASCASGSTNYLGGTRGGGCGGFIGTLGSGETAYRGLRNAREARGPRPRIR